MKASISLLLQSRKCNRQYGSELKPLGFSKSVGEAKAGMEMGFWVELKLTRRFKNTTT